MPRLCSTPAGGLVPTTWRGTPSNAAWKACIARLTNQDDYPDKKFANDCYTHDIAALVKHAKLDNQRKIEEIANPIFGINWLIAKDWNEQARYQPWSELKARNLFTAVSDSNNGVLPWIRSRW